MAFSLLITGGARSGKSSFAEQRVREFGAPLVYIATAEAFDSEMKDRIVLHQARRGPDWETFHAPLNLPQALRETDGKGACLVDCLTIWLNRYQVDYQEIKYKGHYRLLWQEYLIFWQHFLILLKNFL